MPPRRRAKEQEEEQEKEKGKGKDRRSDEGESSSLIPPKSRTAPPRGLGIESSRASLPRNDNQDRGSRTRPSQTGLETEERSSPPSSPSPASRGRSTSTSRFTSPSLRKPRSTSAMSDYGTGSSRRRRTSISERRASSNVAPRTVSGSKRRRAGSGAEAGSAESSLSGQRGEDAPSSSTRDDAGAAQDRMETGRASRTRLSAEELRSRRYNLRVIQSPTTGSAFGTNLLARLALAPPLIVELIVTDSNGAEIPALDELSHLVCHIALLTDTGQAADLLSPVSTPSNSPTNTSTSNPTPPSRRASLARRASRRTSGGSSRSRSSGESQRSLPESPVGPLRMLYGTLVASPQQLCTPDNVVRCLFLFPEVSVRARGRYRLQVTLMRIPLPGVTPSEASPTLATVVTAPFQVVLSVEYVAPHITTLTHHLAQQGVGLLLPPGQLED